MRLCYKKNVFLFCFILVLWGVYGYAVERICGFSVFQDEFGYWANAAKLAGYDWSGCAGISSYYSYGYSLLLTVILRMFQDSMAAYRAAVALNVVLICGAAVLLWKLADSIFIGIEENRKIYALGVAVFYPPVVFYTQMTMTESLLTFLFILACYLLLKFCESEKTSTAVVLAVVLAYMFYVHMRTAGIVCACVFVLGWYGYRNRSCRKKLFAGAAVWIVCMLLGLWLKDILMDAVYGAASQEVLQNNDVTGQLDRVKSLFSVQGIYNFMYSAVGKLFYLGMASWGTLYFAAAYCVRHFRRPLVQFAALGSAAQFMISALFMSEPGRIDTVIYGRYNDYLMPLVIMIGVLEMTSAGHLLKKAAAVAAGNGIAACVLVRYMERKGLYLLKGYFAAGMGYVWRPRKSWDTDVDIPWEIGKAYLACAALMLLLVLLVLVIRRMKYMEWVLCIFIAVEIALTMALHGKYTFVFNDVNRGCLRVADYLRENGAEEVVYVNEDGFPYIDLVQFYMRELTVEVWNAASGEDWKEFLEEDVCVIVNEDCTYLEEMEEVMEPLIQSGNMVVLEWQQDQ